VLGVTVAVENYYPELPIIRGEVYDYSVWPPEPGGQIRAVDHPAVGICLDVGHAALAADVFGFDYIEECAAAAPLVPHLHLHDNLMRTNLTGTPPVSEHPVTKLSEKPGSHLQGSFRDRREEVFWPILASVYPPNSRSERCSYPFSDSFSCTQSSERAGR